MHDATVVLIYTYIAGTNVVPVPFYGGCGVYKKKRHPRGWYRRGTGTFETAWVPWTRFKDFACASMIHRGLSYCYSAQAAAQDRIPTLEPLIDTCVLRVPDLLHV